MKDIYSGLHKILIMKTVIPKQMDPSENLAQCTLVSLVMLLHRILNILNSKYYFGLNFLNKNLKFPIYFLTYHECPQMFSLEPGILH